jgi:hypothetical protein
MESAPAKKRRERTAEDLRSSDSSTALRAASRLNPSLAKDAAEPVASALSGSIAAARRLRQDLWPAAIAEVAEAIGAEDSTSVMKVVLDAHLHMLPTFAPVFADSGAALMQWATVGVRHYVTHIPTIYAVTEDLDETVMMGFERALVEAGLYEVGPIERAKQVLGASASEIGKWVGATGTSVSYWDAGKHEPQGERAARLLALGDLATLLSEEAVAERIPTWFTTTPIPAFDEMSTKQALDAGWDPRLVTDFVRYGLGHEPLTAEVQSIARGQSTVLEPYLSIEVDLMPNKAKIGAALGAPLDSEPA